MDWLEELERLEKAITPGPWEWRAKYQLPNCYGGLENRWYVGAVGDLTRTVSLALVSEADETMSLDDEAKSLIEFRNAAPRLLAIARAAQAVADCGWGMAYTPESYHDERIAKMEALRKALKEE